jgi:DNA mismatch repair protein MutS
MADKLTPMMRQYRGIKQDLADDIILFYRLGDFFEMFFEDAKRAAPILGISLTRRNGYPMCGVPYHAANGYLAKLMKAGCKVAICDQVEDAAEAKGIVRREVTRVITPGTVLEENILESNQYNFLAGVVSVGRGFGMALIDLSTGHLWGEEVPDVETLRDTLRRYSPSECLIPEALAGQPEVRGVVRDTCKGHVTLCDDWLFAYDAAHDTLIRHFAVRSLSGFGCDGQSAVVQAAGGVLAHVRDELRCDVSHVRTLQTRRPGDFLMLDETTCSNLDLVPQPGQGEALTLLKVLDQTRTPMGARKLRDWVLRPLADGPGICARHDAVQLFVEDRALLAELRETLSRVRDLERLITRLNGGAANARDLLALGISLGAVPDVRELVDEADSELLRTTGSCLSSQPELAALVEEALVDEPPLSVKEGGIIRDGYHEQLDELRAAASQGRSWLAEYQAAEMERTGIRNLKVRHNRVFGYYIEISKGQLANVPEEYIRKQTLVNAERFITPALKEYESTIMGAQDRSMALEYELFQKIREQAVALTGEVQETAEGIAVLDVLGTLAERALACRYVRPTIVDGTELVIREGRHPVIEQMPDAERFVPNDVDLNGTTSQLAIITGPNMSGKSTYIRQVAMLVVMAQMGSFVPAESATIGVVDRVFTRVGASDDLARGRSTFMVEMEETANILNNATPRSLVVLDEIGRGTSTFDGISIAWAVAEYLHNTPEVKAKTLFATHYHELTDLSLTMNGVRNFNVLVRERDDKVVFLRKIVPGGADKSYGIAVARLAGMPQGVVDRAKEILVNLEEGELADGGQPKLARHRKRKRVGEIAAQLDLFGS